MKRIPLQLPPAEAMALANMCKRFIYDDAVHFSNRHDGGEEREHMRAAIYKLYAALREAGFAPR